MDGRVDSPPTWENGMLYFGSANGWIYSIRAADGKLAWRYRAAPGDDQIVAYNQLESVWPARGTALVGNPVRDQPALIPQDDPVGRSGFAHLFEHLFDVLGGDRIAVHVLGALGHDHDVGAPADRPARLQREVAGLCGAVRFAVDGPVGASNIGRQRDMPLLLHQ